MSDEIARDEVITKDEIRVNGIKRYNLSAMRRHKIKLQAEKDAGVTYIEDENYPQEVLELIEVENEGRRMRHESLDEEMANIDARLTDYSKLPLEK